jgi:hypothetical protein
MSFQRFLMALLPLSVVFANAHPGHGMLEHGAGHVASSAYHLFVLAGIAVVMFGVAQVVRSATARKYLRVTGAAALLAAGTLWGLGL